MRLAGILSIFIMTIAVVSALSFVTIMYLGSESGCGCSNIPIFTIARTNDSTGSYANITYIDQGSFKEVTDLTIISGTAGDSRLSANNTTLVPGMSYLYKINDTGPTHLVAKVTADGNEMIVIDSTIA